MNKPIEIRRASRPVVVARPRSPVTVGVAEPRKLDPRRLKLALVERYVKESDLKLSDREFLRVVAERIFDDLGLVPA